MLYVACSIILPFATLIVGSFAKLFGFFFIDDAWTVSHWLAVLLDETFLRSAVNSIMLGIAVGTLGLIVYSLIAWVLERGNLWGGSLVGIMVWLPWFADLRGTLDGYKTFFAPGILLLTIVAIGLQIVAWRSLNRMRRVVA